MTVMQADTRTIPEATTAERLRALCACLRIKPTPLADIIPVLQKAADELDSARSTVRAPVDTLHAAIMNLSERPGDESAYTLSERIAYKKGHKAARHAAAELVAASAQEAALQQGDWISVDERLPEPGQTVLCYWPRTDAGPLEGWQFATAMCWPGAAIEWHNPEDDEDDYVTPTYWQPLPPPPASLQQHDQQEGA